MRRFKLRLALAWTISALMLMAAVSWGAEAKDLCQEIDPGEKPPVMTQVAVSGWEEGRQLYRLEFQQLILVPKRWGPFVYEDYWDLLLEGCRLKAGSETLAATLINVGKTLLLLGGHPQPAVSSARLPDEPEPQGSQAMTLVRLPPRIEAKDFSCRIDYPGGRVLEISADLATIDPSNPFLDLEGNVSLSLGTAILKAPAAIWAPLEERFVVLTPYTLTVGKRHQRGSNAHFSLASGMLRRQRPRSLETAMAGGRQEILTPTQVMINLWSTGDFRKSDVKSSPSSAMLMTTLQARAQNGVLPLPTDKPPE